MLKAISMWALRDNEKRPARSLFAEAKEHGFQGIELTMGTAGIVTPQTGESEAAQIRKAAQQEGIAISSLASGLGWQHPLSSEDPQVRNGGIEIQKAALRIGGWLGVDCLLLVPGMVSGFNARGPEHVPYDVAIENMRASITKLIPAAEKARVKIGVENVWNKVLLSPLEMRDFADGFRSPWVVSYLDVGNMIVTGYAEDWVKILGKRISCVHFKDFKREVGTLAGFCDLLEGDVNYPAVMKGLRAVGYNGPCVAEFFGIDSAALRKVSGAMDRIFTM